MAKHAKASTAPRHRAGYDVVADLSRPQPVGRHRAAGRAQGRHRAAGRAQGRHSKTAR